MHMHQSFADKRDAPGVFEVETRVPNDVLQALARRGHRILLAGEYGIASAMVAVGVDAKFGTLRGGADVRAERYAFGW
jgi:gamma-glutamyltranspeptidase/glutathione hydrolase